MATRAIEWVESTPAYARAEIGDVVLVAWCERQKMPAPWNAVVHATVAGALWRAESSHETQAQAREAAETLARAIAPGAST